MPSCALKRLAGSLLRIHTLPQAQQRQHLEQVAYHHANVSAYQEPQLEFEA